MTIHWELILLILAIYGAAFALGYVIGRRKR
jgi:hypothetical protein